MLDWFCCNISCSISSGIRLKASTRRDTTIALLAKNKRDKPPVRTCTIKVDSKNRHAQTAHFTGCNSEKKKVPKHERPPSAISKNASSNRGKIAFSMGVGMREPQENRIFHSQ